MKQQEKYLDNDYNNSFWIKKKPKSWSIKKIREIFKFSKGNGLSKSLLIKDGLYDCVHYGEIYTKYKYQVDIVENLSKTNQNGSALSGKGHLISPSSTTTIGEDLSNCKSLKREGVVIGGDVIIYTPRNEINNIDLDYFSLFITYVSRTEFSKFAKCTTICHIYETEIKNFKVLVPPYDEQTKISKFLKSKLNEFNKLINLSKKKISYLSSLKNTIINNEIFKEYPMPKTSYGIEFINEIALQKNITKIKYLVSKVNGGQTPKGGGNIYVNEGVKFLREQNVFDGYLKLKDVVHINQETHQKMKNSKVLLGDVLLNMTGASIGRCCEITDNEEFNINQHIALLRPKKNLNSKFLNYFLMSHWGKEQTKFFMESAGKEALSAEKIKNYFIPNISLETQLKISNKIEIKLNQIDSLLEKEIVKRKKIDKLIENYAVNYLTGKSILN
ncbi:restriction endonuclease subunit S [Candidatus Pelagibacter sp.]|uniref:restriction endonuclease subunit S n=1 Tax=Candidatus Pelagibacter sp. TaxID=2024849 RepID=UPI003F8248B7